MNGEVIENRRWARIHKLASGGTAYASKFLTDGMEISIADLEREWPSWSEDEKLDFASAYKFKPEFSTEDAKVLSYLIEKGNDRVFVSIARLLPKHPDRARMRTLLLHRLHSKSEEPKASVIAALEDIGGAEVTSTLRKFLAVSRSEINETGSIADTTLIIDYLYCCVALEKLESDPHYRTVVEEYLTDSRELVRRAAEGLLNRGAAQQ